MSVDKKIIAFLKNNPGATPREIADALGIPLNLVRVLLTRLRESGYVMKSSRGGYVVRVTKLHEAEVSEEELRVHDVMGAEKTSHETLTDILNALRKEIDELKKRISKIESELSIIRKSIKERPYIEVKPRLSEIKGEVKEREEEDKLISELRSRKVLSIDEARRLAIKSLETYFTQGIIIPISNYVVLKEFYDEMKRKFPIKITDVGKLSREERLVLDALIKEGMVYLHGGREYRLIE